MAREDSLSRAWAGGFCGCACDRSCHRAGPGVREPAAGRDPDRASLARASTTGRSTARSGRRRARRSRRRSAGALPATGVIDTRTREALGRLGRPLLGHRTIQPGDLGLDVSVLQFLLARAGYYHGALDGYAGERLETAIRAFQKHARLSVDGQAGRATLTRLSRRCATTGPRRNRPMSSRQGHAHDDRRRFRHDCSAARAHEQARSFARAPDRHEACGPRRAGASRRPVASLMPTAVDRAAALNVWADKIGVPSQLVRALAWMESGYQPSVVSSVGAQGVLQVMPTTRSFVEEVLVGHPLPQTLDGDIEVGVLYLKHLLDQFNGNTPLALGAWYQGEAAVRQFGLYKVTKPFVDDVLALQSRM